MTDSSRGYQQFFAEMKRRHVFRVMAAYGVIGFGVIEAAGEIFPRVGIPDWAVTLVVWLVLLGFPIAVVLAWVFESSPEGMKRTADATDEEISEIIAQPAAKRWTAGLLALAGVVLLFGGWWMGRTTADSNGTPTIADARLAFPDPADDPRPSIAVLPFVNMSSDEEQEHFSDGMTEEILNVLVKTAQFRVPARTSVFTYKGQDKDARQIGSELGVSYLVEGSVRKAGETVRITAQLIDAETDEHLVSKTYDRELTAANLFAIQTEIAEAIAEELRVPLGLEGGTVLVTPTQDIEAYDLYLAGRASLRDRPRVGEAIKLFEAAIAHDSTWAPAWASLAEAIEVSTWYPLTWEGGEPENATARLAGERQRQQAAEVAALRALELDPSVASAHVALGSVYRYRNEWERSEAHYLQALAVDPDNAEALQQYAEMLGHSGRIAEGVRLAERALVLDPTPVKLYLLSSLLGADGRPEESLARAKEGMELYFPDATPNLYSGHWYYFHLMTGQYEKMLERAPSRHIDAGDSIRQAIEARDPSLMPADLVDPYFLMVIGETDDAAELLSELVSKHPGAPGWVWESVFDPIRDYPAMQDALDLVNLVGVEPQRTAEIGTSP